MFCFFLRSSFLNSLGALDTFKLIIWLGLLSVKLRNMIGQFAVGLLPQLAIMDFLVVLAGKRLC